MSDVTFKCIYIFGQKHLQWIRQVNGSILQLSQHTKINKTLPKELYQRLEVKVDDESRVYILTVHNATKADEGEYVCTKKNGEEEVTYTLYIISEVYGTTIFIQNMSTVTLNCSYQYKQWDLEWIRQANDSKQLQLSLHTTISKELPKELYERLEVRVKSGRRVYYLIIHNATTTDEGEYICIDKIEKEGALYARYTLFMIQPMEKLELWNETTNNRLNGVEGQDFHIKCAAIGGQPPPFLTIKMRKKLVAQGKQSVVHTIKTITRDFDNASIECVANDSALNTELSTEAYIFLNLKPLAPIFDRVPVVLKEIEPLEISCTSIGSRPAALFNWFMEDKNITSYSTQKYAYDYTTDTWIITSVLTYTVVRQTNGQLITCRAINEADPVGISASQPIHVQSSDLNINHESNIPAVVGSSIGCLALVIVGAVIFIAIRKKGCKLEKKADSKTKAESNIHLYQNQEFATRENRYEV
ncbi:Hypothetical predicted protein [Mytilus galloprovincialis]|uniref:Ig-like domain-containing protein n=1 Tax=Mytilus galloprovincialis TaxID=29158 RepID=A0A8B6GM54_MYTGA|nr:Hypothetical predicted protein [Mytilus galloprovincialis]